LAYEARRAVKIPVIGLGGIENAVDALEYLLIGASAVQVGTANFSQPAACLDIRNGLEKWCMSNNINAINMLIGSFQPDSP
jgi:dihydroorotate dehydrogenase (NAD+) catalytic subunit